MPLRGTLANTQLIFSQENVKVATANTSYSTLTTRTLSPGTWLIHVDFAPSQDSGAYPNGDPDPYQIAIQAGSSTLVSVNGEETNSGNLSYTNQRSASLFYVHAGSSNQDFNISYRQPPGDGDAGGMAGRLSYHMYRLLNYS